MHDGGDKFKRLLSTRVRHGGMYVPVPVSTHVL